MISGAEPPACTWELGNKSRRLGSVSPGAGTNHSPLTSVILNLFCAVLHSAAYRYMLERGLKGDKARRLPLQRRPGSAAVAPWHRGAGFALRAGGAQFLSAMS